MLRMVKQNLLQPATPQGQPRTMRGGDSFGQGAPSWRSWLEKTVPWRVHGWSFSGVTRRRGFVSREVWSGRLASIQRLPAPKAGALPGCATARKKLRISAPSRTTTGPPHRGVHQRCRR